MCEFVHLQPQTNEDVILAFIAGIPLFDGKLGTGNKSRYDSGVFIDLERYAKSARPRAFPVLRLMLP